MGYELNRLMQQYGVGAPTIATPAALAPNATAEDKAAYEADKAAYDKYKQSYMTRLGTVPMYGTRQFSTVFAPAANTPIENTVRNAYAQLGQQGFGPALSQVDPTVFNKWVAEAQEKKMTPQQLNEAILASAEKYITANPSDPYSQYVQGYRNLQKTGSFYGDVLNAPTYTYVPKVAPPPPPPAATVVTPTGGGGGGGDEAPTPSTPRTPSTPSTRPTPAPVGQPATPGTPAADKFEREITQRLGWNPYAPSGDGPGATWAGVPLPPPETENMDQYYIESMGYNPYGDWQVGHGGAARGGYIKKKYATGGLAEMGDEQIVSPLVMMAEGADQAPATTTVTEAPVVAPTVAAPVAPDRTATLERMLAMYGPRQSYTEDVAAARQRARAETDAFNEMIQRSLSDPESAQASKAEMYFRLAAAFGAPTTTGAFGENLGLAAREMAGYSRGQQQSAQRKRDLLLAAQQMKMGAAKEDLAAVRALEAESMKDRRALGQEMIKEYIASGKPQSDAGKRAADMGLAPGTPEYQAKVSEFTDLDIQRKLGDIDSKLKALDLAGQNMELREKMSARLTPTELKMKVEAEDLVANGQQALDDLKQAYKLNENSFEGGWLQKAQRVALEAAGSKDPKVVNTRVMENLLGAQGLAKLRATFGGNPTEGERAILLELEGIGAKTKEERAEIMKRAYTVMKERVTREQKRLKDIGSGAYRMTEPGDIE